MTGSIQVTTVVSGYDSDEATEVTSNTHPSAQQASRRRRETQGSSVGSHTKSSGGQNSGRWSNGDCTKRNNDTPMSLMKAARAICRRSSESTSSTTSEEAEDDELCEHDECCKLREEEEDLARDLPPSRFRTGGLEGVEEDVSEAQEEDSCLDLKSKPGVIRFETELLSLAEEEEEEDDDGTAAAPSQASKTTNSGSASSAKQFLLSEERVRAYMKDYYEDFDSIFRHGKSSRTIWESFFQEYYREDILWVRPSSNTLKGDELAEHFANDIEGIRMQLVSVDSIQLLGQTAVVVFTADQELKYRGHPVNDRAVMTMVLAGSIEDGKEKIRIAHEHRCVGKPIPRTRWDDSKHFPKEQSMPMRSEGEAA